jgi:hypothetical protein
MDGVTSQQQGVPSAADAEAEARRLRLAREAEMIAAARAQLDAGQGRTGRDLADWLDAWEGGGALPPR